MPLNACHDCGQPTPHTRYCDRCAAAFRATDGRPRSGRKGSGTLAHAELKRWAWETYDGVCGRCSKPINPDLPWDLGHIVSHAAGGKLVRGNVRPEHRRCNRSNR